MKRITYISKFTRSFPETELEKIAQVSVRNNKKLNITGVLIYTGGIFFQVIEGDEDTLDTLYSKILIDERHTDILCLKTELDIQERLFPNWSMETVNLDEMTTEIIRPIKVLLQNVSEAHQIIKKYTQPAVFKAIAAGINPLNVPSRKVEKIVLFSDIVAFSTLSQYLPVHEVVQLVSQYLDICSYCISAAGGEVTKFIGDSVLAYFPANQTDAAIQVTLDILTEINKLKQIAPPSSYLHLLNAGFSLAKGLVIEGNIGSSVKVDFTILGEVVNIAARLEGLTREAKKALILSETIKQSATKDSSGNNWTFTDLGHYHLKGITTPTQAFSIDHPLVNTLKDYNTIKTEIEKHLQLIE